MNAASPPLVLHVIHHLRMGGLENGLVNLVNRMPVERYRHAIACVEDYSDFRDRIQRPDVEVVALRRSHIGVWRLRAQLHALCRRLQPSILHTRGLSGLDALLPARLAGVRRCVHGEHGWDVDNLQGQAWRPALLRRAHAPLVSRYVTVSRDLERFLVERIGVPAARITQIYNGVDSERFAPSKSKPLHLLPESLRDPDRVLVGTVGRLQAVKDQATLLRAVAALVERRPQWRQRIAVGVVGDGPLLQALESLAESLGVAAITWLPGATTNVPDVMRLFDVFVLPSLNEGISNTVLEALAAGLPVLATHVGGNPELVTSGREGALFAPGDVAALSALLERYAGEPELRLAHGRAARETALRRFSLAAMVAQYQAVYDGLYAQRLPRGDAAANV